MRTLLFLALGAFGLMYYNQAKRFVDELRYDIDGIKVDLARSLASGGYIYATTQLKLTNPTAFTCPILGVDLNIFYSGYKTAHVIGKAFNIPAKGTVVVQLPTVINLASLPATVSQVFKDYLSGGSLPVQTKGHININPLVNIKVDATSNLI